MKTWQTHRCVANVYSLLLGLVYWWACTSIFREITTSALLAIFFPAALLAVVIIVSLEKRWLRLALVGAVTATAGVIFAAHNLYEVVIAVGLPLLFFCTRLLHRLADKSPREFMGNSLLLIGGLVIGLLAAEGAARLMNVTPSNATYWVMDKNHETGVVTGYAAGYIAAGSEPAWAESLPTVNAPRPGGVMELTFNDSTYQIAYNLQGRRGPEVPYTKPADTIRVLIVGDSFIDALQVSDDEMLSAHLNELARHRDSVPNIEFVAAGGPGWGTIDEYLYYREEGYRYEADLVLVVFYANDPANNMPLGSHAVGDERQEYEIYIGEHDVSVERYQETTGQIVAIVLKRLLHRVPRWVIDHSALWRQMYNIVGSPLVVEMVWAREIEANLTEYPSEAWERTADVLRIFDERVEENGGDLALVSIPRRGDLSSEIENGQPAPLQVDITTQLEEISKELAIPWLDLTPYYASYVDEGHSVIPGLYFENDIHWTANGHAVTADILWEWLLTHCRFEDETVGCD